MDTATHQWDAGGPFQAAQERDVVLGGCIPFTPFFPHAELNMHHAGIIESCQWAAGRVAEQLMLR
ncbi:hypothetical protein E2C01_015298 [Portunus trituberculatus]|uniref:Uncharacterized protein n=1 Tax=Portunus trituberculatus TaxID=210409 RepID=A0A5B7DMC7_PORTR|nr:hypothetical protein [Portunus trituberculatus]